MDSFEREIKNDFLTEAKELLAGTEQCFLNLEKSSGEDNLNLLFRLAHNLKGSSKAVGYNDLADFTHKLESLLLALKDHRLAVSKSIVDLLLRSNDYLTSTVELLQNNLDAPHVNKGLSEELVKALQSDQAVPAAQDLPSNQDVKDAPSKVESPEVAEKETSEISLAARPVEPVAAKPKDENVRVSLSKIDSLLNNVGELVIFQAVLSQQSVEAGATISPLMRKTIGAMAKIIKETQTVSMGLRMLPIKLAFQKMERIVRDTSQALGKEVLLKLSGEETEVDKTVLEQLADPLVHLIRNAVDHGIEDREARRAAGKEAVGTVFLSAFHRAGHVVIEIRDDGKGLDPKKLIAHAKSKGLLKDGVELSDEEAFQLIFAPGFSTKDLVTDVSGRGVGMDVVKTNIANLQGDVAIETQLGLGTCFRISLPLTLAIIDGIVVSLADERYVIPLAQVNEFFRAKPSEINFVQEREELLTLRNQTLPAYRLAQLIQRAAQGAKHASDLTALISRDSDGKSFALLVDEVLSQQQIVIKPLGDELRSSVGFMGSAILGDGRPALILDIHELVKSARGNSKTNRKTKQPKLSGVA